MNRVIFFVAFIILLIVPFSINSVNDDGVSYFEIVKKLKNEIISIVVKTEITSPNELVFNEEERLLLNKKSKEFRTAEAEYSENLITIYTSEAIANNKNVNMYLAKFEWLSLKEKEGGVKGIYLNGYDFTNSEKMDSIITILSETKVNTIVLDVKTDNGHILYDSNLQEVNELNNKRVKYDRSLLLEFKQEFNIYLIGRVVAFQDPYFAKNFKNIKQIALAKSEIIDNIRPYGFIVLNADDSFFKLHYNIAKKKNIKVISFGIKNLKADIKLINIKPFRKKFRINISLNNKRKYFSLSDDFQNNIYNTLSALAVISVYKNIFKLDENIFYNFKIPGGRGDHSVIKFNNKRINLIDQSYNSNPLSLKSAIKNYDKINLKKSNKYMLIGDMLELGSHSKRLHRSIAPIINQSKIYKVYVKGKMASIIFKDISKAKKGRILLNKSQIIELIRKDLNNNDYLMIKASLATGFNDIVKDLKGLR